MIIAYVENGVVRGAAELHPPESLDWLPEIAFSVEAGVRRRGVGTILFRLLIDEGRAKRYKILRITTGAENHAMRALGGKFGAHLAFRDGEATGTIDLTRQPQAELAKLASAPFAGTRAVMNFSCVYRTLLSVIAADVYRATPRILLRASGAAFA